MRPTLPRNERGIALAVAVFALVVIGALVTGTFYAGRLEQRTSDRSLHQTQAFGAAEAGTAAVLAGWSTAYNSMAIGASSSLGTTSLGGGNSYSATVTRLSMGVFLVNAVGQHQGPGGSILARRMVAALTRLDMPQIPINGALTVMGNLTLGGTAEIDGYDHGNGWGMCPPADSVVGIRSSTGMVNTNGANCLLLACVRGHPTAMVVDSSVNSNTFTQFGSTDFNRLASMATWTVSGTVTGIGPTVSGSPAVCNTSNPLNWGEPRVGAGSVPQCANHYPIIHAPGNVRLSGGRGQGILLVSGDLELSGGVEFYGPVVVLGNVRSTGTGGHVYGGLMAQNADLNPSILTGNSTVNFSSCAIWRALNGTSLATPLKQRSWAQLY